MTTNYLLLMGAYNNTTGGVPPQSGYYHSGYLDDVRVYSRALSAAEARMLYERPFDMCVSLWPFRTWSIPATVSAAWRRRATGIWTPGRV